MSTILFALVVVLIFMSGVFVLALVREDNSIVDIFYGPAFLAGSWAAYAVYGDGHPRQLLILSLLTVWGVRLAVHLFLRKKGHGEDFRYRKWREEWGETFIWRSFLQIFMLQGAVIVVVAVPVLLVIDEPGGPLGWRDAAGAIIWLAGFLFEAIGDAQLLLFKRDPANKGKIMRSGLWRYTRHPNYFGEATLWWGVFLVGLGAPFGWVGLLSPIAIAFLLIRVSGIPMLEAKYEGNPEFEAYRRRTNAFFPWWPKADSED